MRRLKTWFKMYRWHIVVLRAIVILPLALCMRLGELAEDGLYWADEHLPDSRKGN